MKFVIPAGNVKIFARSIFSLAKLGDEIYIEPLDDSVYYFLILFDFGWLFDWFSLDSSWLYARWTRLARHFRVSHSSARFSPNSSRALCTRTELALAVAELAIKHWTQQSGLSMKQQTSGKEITMIRVYWSKITSSSSVNCPPRVYCPYFGALHRWRRTSKSVRLLSNIFR